MAFIEGTQIFTDSAWKNIEDISGRDRVLVKNFIGDAEFIQPFALKKKQYDGDVITSGAKDWSFTVTPDHTPTGDQFKRNFHYMFSEEPKKEMIKIRDEFGTRTSTISDYDWYKLVGFVLTRGFVRTKPGKPMLYLFLEEDRIEEEIRILGDILDRIGVAWHVQYSDKTLPKIVVSSKNTLVNRLITRLGSKKRKEMFLPDKMIYNSTKELSKLLIDTIKDTSRGETDQIVTTNKALIDSLTLLGTLSGYSVRYYLLSEAGKTTSRGTTKKDSYLLFIFPQVSQYSVIYRKKSIYSGYVYEIDIFDGQVYVKDGISPIWIAPK